MAGSVLFKWLQKRLSLRRLFLIGNLTAAGSVVCFGFTTKSLAKRAEPVMRGPVLAQMKGKEHTAKRRIVLRRFIGESLDHLTPLIKENAQRLLAPHLEKGRIDLVNDFGKTFAVCVTMDILGLDKNDHQTVRNWHSGVADFITS
ncbi:hypothetical protein MOF05_22640, partial [Bacillus haynesii]|nr:hypothetical protein [Bacillus haynesii]